MSRRTFSVTWQIMLAITEKKHAHKKIWKKQYLLRIRPWAFAIFEHLICRNVIQQGFVAANKSPSIERKKLCCKWSTKLLKETTSRFVHPEQFSLDLQVRRFLIRVNLSYPCSFMVNNDLFGVFLSQFHRYYFRTQGNIFQQISDSPKHFLQSAGSGLKNSSHEKL